MVGKPGELCYATSMKQSAHHRIYQWFIRFAQLQLFITIASLPILIAWGLPISLMSPIANLIFSPILTIFLLIASLIFFFEIFYIPNYYLIVLLDKLTGCWLYLIQQGSPRWLLHIPCPPSLFLLLPLLAAYAVIYFVKKNLLLRVFYLAAILIATVLLFAALNRQQTFSMPVKATRGSVTLLYKDKKTIIVDKGALSGTASVESWIDYTLFPAMTKQLGSTHIHKLIMRNLNKTAVKAIEHLSKTTTIDTLVIPASANDNPFNEAINAIASLYHIEIIPKRR